MEDWMLNKTTIVIGGSAGSIQALNKVIPSLPPDFSLAVIVCLHRMKSVPEGILDVFGKIRGIAVCEPYDKGPIHPGCVYFAPANYHLLISDDHTFSLSTEEDVNFSRPCIDLTLMSAAQVYGRQLLGLLLTGANRDGAYGMQQIKRAGGTTIVQNPADCSVATMTRSAIELSEPDFIMNLDEIKSILLDLDLTLKNRSSQACK